MKKIITLLTMLVFSAPLFAQAQPAATPKTVQAPAGMLAAFQQMFPTATNVSWSAEQSMSPAIMPVVSFTADNKSMKAMFSNQGTLLWKETEMNEADVPQAEKDFFTTVFKNSDAAGYYTRTDNKGNTYVAERKWNGHLYWFQFDMNGKELSRMTLK